jgi:hypothetical protein
MQFAQGSDTDSRASYAGFIRGALHANKSAPRKALMSHAVAQFRRTFHRP